MSKVEKLRKKAENAWTDCDSCNSNDKSMWINGYIVGALANQIELPTDEERDKKFMDFLQKEHELGISDKATVERIEWYYDTYFTIDKIKGGQDNE